MARKRRHVVLAIAAGVVLLLSASISAYVLRHGMRPVPSHDRGQPSLPHHVLIATQGSAFKDNLVNALVAQLEARPAYVKVIDVDGLADVDAGAWQAIVIVHSWEFGKPPGVVSDFVARLVDRGKVIDITTSGGGREKLPGVDVISSASVQDEVPALLKEINARLDARLAGP